MQAEAQRLPRVSAAYSFIAVPPGSALQGAPLPLHPVPNINNGRGTPKLSMPGANTLQVYIGHPLLLFICFQSISMSLHNHC